MVLVDAPDGAARPCLDQVPLRGRALIDEPMRNKGSAFTQGERDALGLRGLLPARVLTIDEQVALELEHVRRKGDDLERYIGLAALRDRNERLFFRVLATHLDALLPIVYTPTVGRACQEFSHIFRRPRGVWITPDDVDRIDDILRAAGPDVRLLVVTDNERILGLGDQGAGGIAIPIGKLELYCAAAGIHPSWTLPVSLDVGTDRPELLEDSFYLGYHAPRLRGPAYDALLDAFVEAVARVAPQAVVQWEDFKQHNAVAVLERYRHAVPSFNDDIQGTAAVVLGGLLAARGHDLGRDRVLILGAGAAALGIARLLRGDRESRADDAGPATIALMDRKGLLHRGRSDLAPDQRSSALDLADHPGLARLSPAALADPVEVARAIDASILIGATGSAGAFSEALLREVARHTPAPIVLPLSNPTDRAEATAEQVLEWTAGRAIVATGSPSGDIAWGGTCRTIGQANNVFIFPGVGLGAIVAEARELPEPIFVAAAHELARCVSPARLAAGVIYPPVDELRAVSRRVALAVVRALRDLGLGRDMANDEIEPAVDRAMWWPDYEAEPASS